MSDSQDEKLEKAVLWLREADGLLITAGAGMGVDSGLPDFRGQEGFWRAYPALRHQGLSFEDMANPVRFAVLRPNLVHPDQARPVRMLPEHLPGS